MLNTVRQGVLFAIVMLVLGPIAGRLAAGIRLGDGGAGGLIFDAPGGAGDILKALGIIVLATIACGLGAWLRGPRHAMAAAGLTLAWAAWATPNVDDLLRRTRDGGVMFTLLLDTVFVTVLTLAGVVAALRLSRPVRHRTHDITESTRSMLGELATGKALAPLAAFVIAGSLAGSLLARSPMDGQVFAAACAAGLAGGVLARIIAHPVSLAPILLGAALVAITTRIWGLATGGTGDRSVEMALGGTLPGLAWIGAWAGIAGMLVGIPLGITWAEDLATRQQHPASGAQSDAKASASGVRIKRAAPGAGGNADRSV
ncbi:MAG: hypothetical protein ACTS3F_04200 [Phycisphaerales bacterium]